MGNYLRKQLWGLAFILFPTIICAQEVQEVKRGESITLTAPEGYKTYQWQVSTDGKAYLDLPEGAIKDMSLAVYAPAYYRVNAVKEDGQAEILRETYVKLSAVSYSSVVSVVSAGHGYVESKDGKPGASGISIPEETRSNGTLLVTKQLTNWSNPSSIAAYYFNHPKDTVDTKMVLTVASGKTLKMRLTVWDPTKMEKPIGESYLSITGKGKADTVDIMGNVYPTAQYYRYQLECIEGNTNLSNINRFLFYSHSTRKSYSPNYLSSPSVHLNNWRTTQAGAPTGASFDWCYQEVMMPEESNIVGTYVMSLGVLNGYMGIQMNGWNGTQPKHDVIFSIWDNGSTDEDPNLPDYLRATAVDHSDIATVTRFGGEGTGAKSFCSGNFWDCGKYVQFITNCRPETATYKTIVDGKEVIKTQKNMLVSAWFNAQDGKGWQYIATIRQANGTSYFNSWYSFLENYNFTTGQAMRTGYYRNGYTRALSTKKWYHCNNVGFGHTDGGTAAGARNDWGQGVAANEPGAFFMTTGGFTPTNTKGSSVPLNTVNTPIDTIDIAALNARVEEAIAKEKAAIKEAENYEKSKYNKTGWQVVSFSSQEASGEPNNNGYAALIIDGDKKTYWHSQWQGGQASYPHFFVVDMREVRPVTGFQITMSGGSNRYIKSFDMLASNDNLNWTKVYSNTDAPNMETFSFKLSETVDMRYFKLVINSGRANDGPFVRVNEIEVTGPLGVVGIEKSPVVGNGNLKVYPIPAATTIQVVAPVAMKDMAISLSTVGGTTVFTKHYYDMSENEAATVGLPALANGVYIVSCVSQGKVYSQRIIVKQ